MPPPPLPCDRRRGASDPRRDTGTAPGDRSSRQTEWDDSLLVRLAVERLWIVAGDTAEEYRRAARIDTGMEPWAELSAYRNRLAHALPGDLSSDRIWADTTSDLPRILDDLRQRRD